MFQNLNKYLKALLLILLVTLFIELMIFRLDNCYKCNFKIDNKNYNFVEFYNLYYEECFDLEVSNNFSSLLKTDSPHK